MRKNVKVCELTLLDGVYDLPVIWVDDKLDKSKLVNRNGVTYPSNVMNAFSDEELRHIGLLWMDEIHPDEDEFEEDGTYTDSIENNRVVRVYSGVSRVDALERVKSKRKALVDVVLVNKTDNTITLSDYIREPTKVSKYIQDCDKTASKHKADIDLTDDVESVDINSNWPIKP